MDPSATIAIVGRPNVGKSTLFNRLIGKRQAIVAEEAGTTRDRISHKMEIEGYNVLLVDTGGLESEKQENIEADIQAQAHVAIRDADLILFITDISHDLTVDDYAAADILRKSGKPVILVANKYDNENLHQHSFNLFELGFGEPIRVSAIHKHGLEILSDHIAKNLKNLKFKKAKAKKEDHRTKICILGKPNAGKSSLTNAIVGSEKTIVSDIPGTTRDAIDVELDFEKKKYTLIDTAGLKRPGRTKRGIEHFSALRCLKAIERSDIVVLLIDGKAGITSQDLHITQHALENEKGVIIGINKIDLLEDTERILNRLKRKFTFIPWAPVVLVSAKNKRNTLEILRQADKIMEERRKRIPTAELTSFLQKITQKHLPSSAKMQKPKFMMGSQVDVEPPKFVLHFKYAQNLHFTYPRYLENKIREEYGFNGTAIQLKFK